MPFESNSDHSIYLDNNATTQPHEEVCEVVAHHLRESYANPGSRHSLGRRARQVLEESRESMATILQAEPDEILFTSGGTESTNMAIFGLAGNSTGTVLLTKGEHPATLNCCQELERRGWRQSFLHVDQQGCLKKEQFDEVSWNEVRLVSLILAHNETGVIQETNLLVEYALEHSVPVYLDAVQAVGKIPVRFHDLKVTALSLGAHKFHGPRGIGALLLKKGTRLFPVQFGGHQERERRPGTEAVPLIAGMAKGLEIWHSDYERTSHQIRTLRDDLQAGLQQSCDPCVIHGATAERLPNTLNIAFPGLSGEAILVNLDLAGIACSLGSTCASGSTEAAPVLEAMGCSLDVALSSVRFSLGQFTTDEEIQTAIDRISTVIHRLRSLSD